MLGHKGRSGEPRLIILAYTEYADAAPLKSYRHYMPRLYFAEQLARRRFATFLIIK